MDGSTDRISRLPDFILHHILSLLEPKDAFSAACLSKSWFNVWLTRPDLTFSFYPDVDLPEGFEKFVENTIARYSKSELSVRSLRIRLVSRASLSSSVLANSIRFAVEKHVKILRIHGMVPGMDTCSLPGTIFETILAAKSLIELELRHCYFHFEDRNKMMFSSVPKYDQFNNLKRLIFQDVYLSNHYWEIDKLFCNIPLIEDIDLRGWDLTWLKKLRVISNVPKLKRFAISCRYPCNMGCMNSIEIVAPSLESFQYSDEGKLNIDACQNLKRLVLDVEFETLKSFNSFSNFLFLEFLEIWHFRGSMNLNYNISSRSLKHVRLSLYTTSLTIDADVMIDAPNLQLLECVGDGCNSISFRDPPKQLKVTLSGHDKEDEDPRTWFLHVRSSLMKLANGMKIQLSLHAHDRKKCFVSIKDSEELPEPEVEDLVLYCCDQHKEFEFESLFNAAIGDAHRNLIEVRKGVCFKLKWSA